MHLLKRFLILAAMAGPALAAPPEKALQAVLAKPSYHGAHWGLRVVDRDSGKVLLDRENGYPFYIGSVRKVFSVGLWLNQVGPKKTYDTTVYRQGTVDNGLLNGNLVLVASGDLSVGGRRNADGSLAVPDYDHNEADSLGNALLAEPDPLAGYRELARQVAASGIKDVSGDVVVDDRLWQPFSFRDEFEVTPAFVNDDVVDVGITPTQPGRPAQVDVRPHTAGLRVVSTVSTGPADSPSTLELTPKLPKLGTTATVQGSVPVNLTPRFTGKPPQVQTFRISDPTGFARTVFVEALQKEGVRINAPLARANPVALLPPRNSYTQANQVALLAGTPAADLARWILKVSYNLGADVSLMLLGLTQGVDSMPAALEKEKLLLASQYGVEASLYNFVDGSGGGESEATTQAVTTILTKLAASPAREALQAAFPILATDGSLGFVTRFKSDPSLAGAAGQVRGKTGTWLVEEGSGLLVKGQALAGYIDARSGRHLTFIVVVNEVPIDDLDQLLEVFQDQGTLAALFWRDF